MKIDWNRTAWSAVVLGLLSSAIGLFAPDRADSQEPPPPAEAPQGAQAANSSSSTQTSQANGEAHSEGAAPSSASTTAGEAVIKYIRSAGCIVDEVAVDELKKKRAEIEAKTKELAQKDNELAARERVIEEELKKLEKTREEILALKGSVRRENEEKVTRLVEAIELMSPKSASQLLSSVDQQLAVESMAKLSTNKLSKIMNTMSQEDSTRLAEALAGIKSPPKSKKGGELANASQPTLAQPDLRKPASAEPAGSQPATGR